MYYILFYINCGLSTESLVRVMNMTRRVYRFNYDKRNQINDIYEYLQCKNYKNRKNNEVKKLYSFLLYLLYYFLRLNKGEGHVKG